MQKTVLVIAIVLALAGVWVGMHLTALHVPGAESSKLFDQVCAPDDNPTYNCKEVVKSRWAVFSIPTLSFVDPDPETGRQTYGTPVALFGWFYFSALLVWYILVGVVDYDRRIWHTLLLVVVACSCAVSVFFIYILFARMDVRCNWCLVSHATNFSLLVCTILLRPRRPRETGAPAAGSSSATTAGGYGPDDLSFEPHPQPRLILATIGCIAAVLFGELTIIQREGYKVRLAQNQVETAAYKQEIDRIREDTETQLAWFQAQEAVEIPHRKDDPKRGEGPLLLPIVIFSDFECPHCGHFADDLAKKIVPAFDNLVRIYWKHYPLCNECNPNVKVAVHPYACTAAYASEAARIQGGNDGFWKAHDALFAQQKKLGTMDWRAFASELGFDPDRFVEDMASDAVKKRVEEDVELGKSIGVTGTPAIYLWGRKIQRYMLSNAPFVEEVKKSFLKIRSARLKAQELRAKQRREQGHEAVEEEDSSDATPDNPDPPGAP